MAKERGQYESSSLVVLAEGVPPDFIWCEWYLTAEIVEC